MIKSIRTRRRWCYGVVVFSWRGLAPFFLRDTITPQAYVDVLNTFLLPTVEELFVDGDCIFHPYRAHVNTARPVAECLRDNNILVMDRPAEYPDLNRIEHLWDVLGRRLRARHHRPTRYLSSVQHSVKNGMRFPKKVSRTWLKVCLREWKLSSRLMVGQHYWIPPRTGKSFSATCPDTFDYLCISSSAYIYIYIYYIYIYNIHHTSTVRLNRTVSQITNVFCLNSFLYSIFINDLFCCKKSFIIRRFIAQMMTFILLEIYNAVIQKNSVCISFIMLLYCIRTNLKTR